MLTDDQRKTLKEVLPQMASVLENTSQLPEYYINYLVSFRRIRCRADQIRQTEGGQIDREDYQKLMQASASVERQESNALLRVYLNGFVTRLRDAGLIKGELGKGQGDPEPPKPNPGLPPVMF